MGTLTSVLHKLDFQHYLNNMMIHILLLRVVFLTFTSGQEYVIERLGGREGRIAPALGIKCSTAELKILNEMVEECLEIALTLEVDDFVDSVDELNDGGQHYSFDILLILSSKQTWWPWTAAQWWRPAWSAPTSGRLAWMTGHLENSRTPCLMCTPCLAWD